MLAVKNYMHNKQWSEKERTLLIACTSMFLLMVGLGSTIPFLQSRRDELGCDALCTGRIQSTRSALTLFGGAVVTRLSDKVGRKPMLYAGLLGSLLSLFVAGSFDSLNGMWASLIPSGVLQHNVKVFKALLADFMHVEQGQESQDLGGVDSLGKLGMSVGLGFMFGPLISILWITSYHTAIRFAAVLVIASGVVLSLLPSISVRTFVKAKSPIPSEASPTSFYSFLYVKSATSSGAKLLICIRVCMTLAFHIFNTVLTASLKERFAFGPKEHGALMGWIGLCYALSQGLVAKRLVSYAGNSQIKLLLACTVVLGLGRILAIVAQSIYQLFAVLGLLICALGTANTIISSDSVLLAEKDEIGGLVGVFESFESAAGIVGPILGGIIASEFHQVTAPITAVVLLYFVVFVLVFWGYNLHIRNYTAKKVKQS